MNNVLDKMREENISCLNVLNDENQQILDRMFNYISASNISLFDLEIVKRDLIGLAYEDEQEGKSFCLSVENEQEFSDNIIKNARHQDWREWCATTLPTIMIILLVFLLPNLVLVGAPAKGYAYFKLSDIVLTIWLAAYGSLFIKWLYTRKLYSGKKATFNAVWIAGLLLFGILVQITKGIVLFTYPIWLPATIIAVILVGAVLWRRKYYSDAGRKYFNWVQ